jgi:hypothetical protein
VIAEIAETLIQSANQRLAEVDFLSPTFSWFDRFRLVSFPSQLTRRLNGRPHEFDVDSARVKFNRAKGTPVA